MNFVTTGDGSKTIFNAAVGEHYHSKHGAVQESRHVFLKSGLQYFLEKLDRRPSGASILEVGFGTGLNFLLTADYCFQKQLALQYTGIEAYPLPSNMIRETGYQQEVDTLIWKSFLQQYEQALYQPRSLMEGISFEIAHQTVLQFNTIQTYDIIYFDAFAAIHQPEMWSEQTLAHVCHFLKPGGVFVTYAITGNLKRTMKSLEFRIEKAPGAPGKREMLRAVKF